MWGPCVHRNITTDSSPLACGTSHGPVWTCFKAACGAWTDPGPTPDRPWTALGPNMIAWTQVGPIKLSTKPPIIGAQPYGPYMDLAWTPRGPRMDPISGTLEMDCTGEAMRGPRMDPAWTREWRTRDMVRGEGDAWTSHGPSMDQWVAHPRWTTRGRRCVDPAWTRGVAHPRWGARRRRCVDLAWTRGVAHPAWVAW
jgi:hypothetical protein